MQLLKQLAFHFAVCYILRQEVAYMKLTRREFAFKTVAAAAACLTLVVPEIDTYPRAFHEKLIAIFT